MLRHHKPIYIYEVYWQPYCIQSQSAIPEPTNVTERYMAVFELEWICFFQRLLSLKYD